MSGERLGPNASPLPPWIACGLRRTAGTRFRSLRLPPSTAWVAATFLVALLVRVLYVALQTNLRLFDVSFYADDAVFYARLARSIAEGHGMSLDGHATAYVGPGYPLFLAGLLIAGADTFAVGVVQSVLGALTAVLAGAIAIELECARTGRRPSRVLAAIAGLGVALYPHLVFWTGYLLTETLFVFLAAASLYATVMAANRGSLGWGALAGVASAFAALTRPAYLGVAVIVLLWWVLAQLATARAGHRIALPITFALCLFVPMAAWAVRNAAELGAPIVTSTESGFVFYAGNARGGTGGSRGYLDGRDYPQLTLPAGLSEVEADALYWRQGLAGVLADPASTIGKWPAKLWNMWRPTYEGASLRNGIITLVSYLPVVVLGIAGALVLARGDPFSPSALPGLLLVSWVILHVVVAGMIRFRLPAELVLIVTGSVALHAFASRRARLSSAGHALA